MNWTSDAESALKKVPFFVRKRVRARVEKEAADRGKERVSLADVRATQKRYLTGMEAEVRGYRIEACFGPGGCPNRAVDGRELMSDLEAVLEEADLLTFLRARVKGKLRFHHEFRIALADCPNACSQPQIQDIGIIGACSPIITEAACSACEACLQACREGAVNLAADPVRPTIDPRRCIHCGRCPSDCPTQTIAAGVRGYRVLLGGKLGRHPQLAREVPGIFPPGTVVTIVRDCLQYYKNRSTHGQRFAELLRRADFDSIARRYAGESA